MKKYKFYSSYDGRGGDSSHAWLTSCGLQRVFDPAGADIIVFNGGADIGTSLYNEKPVLNGIPFNPSARDEEEVAIFNKYKGQKFFFGICRGSQLLNVLNGGTLWQHVDNHGSDHIIYDIRTGHKIRATSTHHQMMRPNLKTGEILAVASESQNKMAYGFNHFDIQRSFNIKDGEDVEVVWYPGTRTLCVQGHPEYYPEGQFAEYCLGLIQEFVEQHAA